VNQILDNLAAKVPQCREVSIEISDEFFLTFV